MAKTRPTYAARQAMVAALKPADHERLMWWKIAHGEGDYREHQCVPKAWALAAAREYFETGKRATDLPWAGGD